MQAVHISTKHTLISTYKKYRGIHILLFVLPFHHRRIIRSNSFGFYRILSLPSLILVRMDVNIYMFNSYIQELFICKKVSQQRAEYPSGSIN
jgi:hypothetical protein